MSGLLLLFVSGEGNHRLHRFWADLHRFWAVDSRLRGNDREATVILSEYSVKYDFVSCHCEAWKAVAISGV